MREDYTFYNCYCSNNDPIDFKAYVLNELRNLNYFPWLRDEPRNLTDEKDFLNATQNIPYLEKEIEQDQKRIREAKESLKRIEEHPDEEYEKYVKDGTLGIPNPDIIIKAFEPNTDIEKEYGEVGELCITGPTIFMGYINEDEETKNTLRRHEDNKIVK